MGIFLVQYGSGRKCGGKEFLEILAAFMNNYYPMKGQEESFNTLLGRNPTLVKDPWAIMIN